MTASECAAFINEYSSASRGRIAFAWNQRHGKDFVDANHACRDQVSKMVLEAPGLASVGLIRDLFEAEAHYSKEAWCISLSFRKLGALLLKRGGLDHLDDFVANFAASFDAYTASHTMDLDPVTVASISNELARRLGSPTDPVERKRLELAKDLFEKYKAGNPAKDVVMIPGEKLDALKSLKVYRPSWLETVRRLLKF